VGPDLVALLVGARGRFAELSRVWIRVHEIGGARPATAPFTGDRDSPVSAQEAGVFAKLEEVLRL